MSFAVNVAGRSCRRMVSEPVVKERGAALELSQSLSAVAEGSKPKENSPHIATEGADDKRHSPWESSSWI